MSEKYNIVTPYSCTACNGKIVEVFTIAFPEVKRRGPRVYGTSLVQRQRNRQQVISNWYPKSHGFNCSTCGLVFKKERKGYTEEQVYDRLGHIGFFIHQKKMTPIIAFENERIKENRRRFVEGAKKVQEDQAKRAGEPGLKKRKPTKQEIDAYNKHKKPIRSRVFTGRVYQCNPLVGEITNTLSIRLRYDIPNNSVIVFKEYTHGIEKAFVIKKADLKNAHSLESENIEI